MKEYKGQILHIFMLTVFVVIIVGGIVYLFNVIGSALLGNIAFREVNDSTKLIKVSTEDINLVSKSLTRIFFASITLLFIINIILNEIYKQVKVILKRTIEKRKNERITSNS